MSIATSRTFPIGIGEMILTIKEGDQASRQVNRIIDSDAEYSERVNKKCKAWSDSTAIRHLHRILTKEGHEVGEREDGVIAFNSDGSRTKITLISPYKWITERKSENEHL